MNTQDRLDCFKKELSFIKNVDMMHFASSLITDAPDYFFSVPASSSGKYHPDFARKTGGLVLHTKSLVGILHILLEEHELWACNDLQRDIMYVSAIAHDIQKQGNGERKHTVTEHPLLAAKYIKETYEKHKFEFNIDESIIDKICSIVSCHMGKWYEKQGLPVPKTRADFLLCTADVISSRKEWGGTFDDEPKIIQDMLLTETLTNGKSK